MEEVLLTHPGAAQAGRICAETGLFSPGVSHDILWPLLTLHYDARGWLCELFRQEELPPKFHPAMAHLWDNCPHSPTFRAFQTTMHGADKPMAWWCQ